jgi:DDE superfamily endonuclease
VALAQLLMKQLMNASQDGNRENITLMATIYADGSRIPPALIYQSEAGLIQDTWLDDFDENKEITYFAVTQKGWTNENAGLYWLEHVFDRHTKAKADNYRRLLIPNGHNSHVNMRFINYCDQNRILLVIFPPYSTYRLQSLDVNLFKPLAQYYTQQLNQFMVETQGLVHIIKRHFWKFFIQAFT